MADETGAAPDAIALAFTAVRDSYGMPALNDEINAARDASKSNTYRVETFRAPE